MSLDAGRRPRDVPDLDLLAPRTNADALVDRWNQLIKWHGDRHAILGFADALVAQLRRLVAVRLSGRQVHVLERRSGREATGLSEALRRCVDEWAATQDAAPTQSKQEAIKKQLVAVGPDRRAVARAGRRSDGDVVNPSTGVDQAQLDSLPVSSAFMSISTRPPGRPSACACQA